MLSRLIVGITIRFLRNNGNTPPSFDQIGLRVEIQMTLYELSFAVASPCMDSAARPSHHPSKNMNVLLSRWGV
jgi:hypothetical protein